jgi:hypothetical protein
MQNRFRSCAGREVVLVMNLGEQHNSSFSNRSSAGPLCFVLAHIDHIDYDDLNGSEH